MMGCIASCMEFLLPVCFALMEDGQIHVSPSSWCSCDFMSLAGRPKVMGAITASLLLSIGPVTGTEAGDGNDAFVVNGYVL